LRILQIIDSLRSGGAEKMALNLTNSLLETDGVEWSGLCVTRKEGILKAKINSQAHYLFLKKRNPFDINAIINLRNFIKKHEIGIIHVHGTSFFLGFIIKILAPSIILIWHDHLGIRAKQSILKYPFLLLCSLLFDGVIVVSKDLLSWAKASLFCMRIIFIPNFIYEEVNQLPGYAIHDKKKYIELVCLANLRVPKNHLNLLKAFKIVSNNFKNVRLTLIGKKYEDKYQQQIEAYIKQNNLEQNVRLLGEQEEILKRLKYSDIGVLASNSEGLSMAILEYGMAGLPVIISNVGECPAIVGEYGRIVNVDDPVDLASNIRFYLKNEHIRTKDAIKLNIIIKENYSQKAVIPKLMQFYRALSN
jgi:glycosyltransferase involved in cell wall biosynthesis